MKIKKSMLVLLTAGLLTVTGCNHTSDTSVAKVTQDEMNAVKDKNVTLNMSVFYNSEETKMHYAKTKTKNDKVFTKSDTYEHVSTIDGSVKSYKLTDLKPTWAAVQDKTKLTINDVTPDGQSKIKTAFTFLQSSQFKGINIAQGSVDDIQNEALKSGTILSLSNYLDVMPNFKAFLDKYPAVASFIKDSKGNMYYAPYFDGLDDIERMLMVRGDWVRDLLNVESTTDTAHPLERSAYTPFYGETDDQELTVVKADGSGTEKVHKKKTYNIITKQNELISKGKGTGAELTKALRDYIKATYLKADGTSYYGDNLADLFAGQNAAYDVDELIALFRCVKTSAKTLTGNEDTEIGVLFPRDYTNDRTADLWRFLQFFGVRGVESRSGYLYINSQGKVVDARGDADLVEGVDKLNQMFAEGLIGNGKDFTDKANGGTNGKALRDYYLGNAGLTGTQPQGFAIYDYCQTQAAYNSKIAKLDANGYLQPLLPAMAKWNGSDKYTFFTESWRSVKTEGWFITAETAKDKDKLCKALQLFDFFYSEEGNRLMSYGPDEYLAHNADGTIKYMNYQGKQVPVLGDSTLKELKELAGGNYTNYYRFWLGATLPVGYVKEQGMEYQTVDEKSKPGLDNINKAIELGVLEHVNFKNNKDKFYNISPTTFALTTAEANSLGNNFNGLSDAINNTKGKTNIWSSIVIKGWGAKLDNGSTLPTKEGYVSYVKGLKLDDFVNIYDGAYQRIVGELAEAAVVYNKTDF